MKTLVINPNCCKHFCVDILGSFSSHSAFWSFFLSFILFNLLIISVWSICLLDLVNLQDHINLLDLAFLIYWILPICWTLLTAWPYQSVGSCQSAGSCQSVQSCQSVGSCQYVGLCLPCHPWYPYQPFYYHCLPWTLKHKKFNNWDSRLQSWVTPWDAVASKNPSELKQSEEKWTFSQSVCL